MDWQSLVIFIVVVMALFYFTGRRRRRDQPRLTTALDAIQNVNEDMRILELHTADRQNTKKFRNGGLADADNRLNFLDAATLTAIKESYAITNEFNQRIDMAKKAKTPAILQDLPLDKLAEPLNKSKAGLVTWLKDNPQAEIISPRRSFLGF